MFLKFQQFINESERPENYRSIESLSSIFSSMKEGKRFKMSVRGRFVRAEFVSYDKTDKRLSYKIVFRNIAGPTKKVKIESIYDVNVG